MPFSNIVALVFFLAHLGLVAFFEIKTLEHYPTLNVHAALALGGCVAVSFAAIFYRIFRGLCTRQVKYIHMFVGVAAIGAFAASIIVLHITVRMKTHRLTSMLILGFLVIQFVMGATVFIYLSQPPKIRTYFAPFHDIIGIWILLCLVCIYLVGMNKDKNISETSDKTPLIHMNLLMYAAFICPIIVVLCPYFEWELVGAI